jgi:hypothetical protein
MASMKASYSALVVDPALVEISDSGAARPGLLHALDDTLAIAALYRVLAAENQRDGVRIALHKVARWIRDATLVG